MAKRIIGVNVELETDVDGDLADWAELEARSKRRQLAVLARKLTTLRKTQPDELRRLGLLEAATR